MGVRNWFNFGSKEIAAVKQDLENAKQEIELAKKEIMDLQDDKPGPGAYSTFSYAVSYNGEKNQGEMGPIREYMLDFQGLRLRSWQCFLDSEIAQFVLKKFTKWVIGRGLKLQAEPAMLVLKSEKIKLNPEEFNDKVEARFEIFAKSENSDHSRMQNLNMIANEAHKNAMVGGDVLVILRYEDDQVTVQLVDGSHVCSPAFDASYLKEARSKGNVIRHGVELSPKGEHVAYYVRKGLLETERIPARGEKSGLKMAFMVYGLKYRIDDVRGLPLIAAVMETLSKLDRYKEATVGSAEERAKIVYSVEHEHYSTGESHLVESIAKSMNADSDTGEIPLDVQGKQMADKVAVSTNKQTFNMPVGAKLKALDSKQELQFKDFYTTNIIPVCAAVEIPAEVAMSKYDSNFSASRAALKDWEHTINVSREYFSFQFYQPIYAFWLDIQILLNKVEAPGYLLAKASRNNMVLDSYRNARFIGASVPHIDPLKEVEAERLKLGALAVNIPLTTVEKATEALNGGDSDSNMEQFAEEFDKSQKLKLVTPENDGKKVQGNQD
jgi:capsid protein